MNGFHRQQNNYCIYYSVHLNDMFDTIVTHITVHSTSRVTLLYSTVRRKCSRLQCVSAHMIESV